MTSIYSMTEILSAKAPITTITLFKFKGVKRKWWAFREMGMNYPWNEIKGLLFAKKLGTGGGTGFSVTPNFSVYAWLLSWENEACAQDFFKNNTLYNNWTHHAENQTVLYLSSITSHGTWHEQEPFQGRAPTKHHVPVAVITRARVKSKYLFSFWRQVPSVNKNVLRAEGKIFAIGIGELPFFELATLSVWKDEDAVKNFAYGNPKHKKAIKYTRKLNWYQEELFARFYLEKQQGAWPGLEFPVIPPSA